MTLDQLNERSERVKLYIDGQLSKRFRMPVICSDEVARVIALSSGLKDGEYGVWLNGNLVRINELQLSLHLELRNQQGKTLLERQPTQEDE